MAQITLDKLIAIRKSLHLSIELAKEEKEKNRKYSIIFDPAILGIDDYLDERKIVLHDNLMPKGVIKMTPSDAIVYLQGQERMISALIIAIDS